MSILTTIKFIVRGKSVDFKNREGSSPSIPKKPILTPKIVTLSPFFVSGSKFPYPSDSLTNVFWRKCLSLITCDIEYTLQMKQGMPI